ncbi:MAG: hypothetical protein LBN98_06430 [Prevotellaceae bacterium]|jgi:hypothetical protein|nr:hypothetical protein [Prevotellaceae bacterium]
MKKILTIIMLFGVCCGYAQNTPPHAASTRTWTFGNQTWSDAIQIPGCHKETFEKSNTNPQCRSYTEGANTWYYYNWPYVNHNHSTMCPSPWRVPSHGDLTYYTSHAAGHFPYAGGWYSGSAEGLPNITYYWSNDMSAGHYAYVLEEAQNTKVAVKEKYFGLPVRCVLIL